MNPFPGLRPFLTNERFLFFGRERQVAEIVQRLQTTRFLAVVGTSGSGKSSLVRAGLLPELHGGTMTQAGSHWEMAVMRPGGGPIHKLAQALLEADVCDPEQPDALPQLLATINRSRSGLVEAIRQAGLPPQTNLLLVVDQFEEIFRFHSEARDGDEHAIDFVNLLLEAVNQSAVPIYVVLTMRSDFLGDCAQFPGLAEAVNDGEYLIPRLTRDQHRLAIEGPVRVGGAEISSRLVQRLLNEIGDDPDQLPILQHALMRTWDHWSGSPKTKEESPARVIDIEDYEAVGGMAESLSRHADEVYASLTGARQRRVAERLFKALTERGRDQRGTRRPSRVRDLASIAGGSEPEVIEVVAAFRAPGRTFLMPMEPASLTADTVVDVSHESLMRVWQQLRHWTDEEAQSARIFGRLAESAALHALGRAGFYRDPDLQIALTWREAEQPTHDWAKRYHPGFEDAMRFLDASAKQEQDAAAERESARQREVQQARALAEAERQRAEEQAASARKLRALVRVLGLVAMLALTALVSALISRRLAHANAESAQIREQLAVASRAQALKAKTEAERLRALAERQNYGSTIGHAHSLVEMQRFDQAQRVLIEETPEPARSWEWGRMLYIASRGTLSGQPISAGRVLAFSPDGSRIASQAQDGVRVRNVRNGAELGYFTNLNQLGWELSFSPDGKQLAIGSLIRGAWASVIDAESGRTVHVLTHCLGAITFSPDGNYVVAGTTNFGVQFFDARTGKPHGPELTGHADLVNTARFSRDGRYLLTAAGKTAPQAPMLDLTVRVWDAATRQLARVFTNHVGSVWRIAFHPDGRRVATSGIFDAIRIWDYTTGEQLLEIRESIRLEAATQPPISGLDFTRDGKFLLSGSTHDKRVLVHESDTGRLATIFPVGAESSWVTALQCAPDGQHVATGDYRGASLLDLRDPVGSIPVRIHQDRIKFIEFSRDGTRMLTGARDGSLRLSRADSLELIRTFVTGNRLGTACLTPDNQRVVAAGLDGAVTIWDARSGVQLLQVESGLPEVSGISVGARGEVAAVFAPGRGLGLFNPRTGALVVADASLELPMVTKALVHPERDQLFCVLSQRGAQIRDAKTGGVIRDLEVGSTHIIAAALSADGKLLATSDGERSIHIWDATDGQLRSKFRNSPTSVEALVFHPEGKLLISVPLVLPYSQGADDRPVGLWDLETGRLMASIGGSNQFTVAAFHPNGRTLLLGDASGTIHLWNSHPWRAVDFPGSPAMRFEDRLAQLKREGDKAVQFGPEQFPVLALRAAEPRSTRPAVLDELPPRPSHSPAALLDLTRFYNGVPWAGWLPLLDSRTRDTRYLNFPRGVARVGGVLYDLRGLVQLGANRPEPDWQHFPLNITNVSVGNKLYRLHLLHSVVFGPLLSIGTPVTALRVHFKNGSKAERLFHYGPDFSDWTTDQRIQQVERRALDGGGLIRADETSGYKLLFHSVWTNSTPDLEIASVDYASLRTIGAPFLVAMTAELGVPIEVLRQPTNTSAFLGGKVEFRIEVLQPDRAIYQWLHDGKEIPHATNSVLTLEKTRPSDAGAYQVRIQRAGSDDTVIAESSIAHLALADDSLVYGAVLDEIYNDIPGSRVTNLLASATFPSQPSQVRILRELEAPPNSGDDFGRKLSGFILPPVSGDYLFYLNANDSAELHLSTDETVDRKVRIVHEAELHNPRSWVAPRRPPLPSNRSRPIKLEAGRRYYFEVLHKERGLGDNVGVCWQLPGAPPPVNGDAPIPGSCLAIPRPAAARITEGDRLFSF